MMNISLTGERKFCLYDQSSFRLLGPVRHLLFILGKEIYRVMLLLFYYYF
jgi:hypothetical protein